MSVTVTGSPDDLPRDAQGSDETYDLALLDRSAAKWRASPGLRVVYEDIYRAMQAYAPPGPVLEIGSGIGVMRETVRGLVTSDVRKTPYVDLAASAYALEEVPGGPWQAIHLLDVLHHLREPFRFFASAARALAPGGRVVICDPAATPFGRWIYRAAHHEPINPERVLAPYVFPPDAASGEFANMGMAWALFARDRTIVEPALRAMGLKWVDVRFRDFCAYLLTGGFSRPALLPASALRRLLGMERLFPRWMQRFAALRMIVVLERTGAVDPEAMT